MLEILVLYLHAMLDLFTMKLQSYIVYIRLRATCSNNPLEFSQVGFYLVLLMMDGFYVIQRGHNRINI